jgi:Neuraminidase (sialidase)
LTRWILVVIIGTIAGCAASSPLTRPSTSLLGKADRLVSQGQYAGAIETYGEILTKYPDTDEAKHARSSRDTLSSLLATRAQVARLTAEMKAQEAELVRAREQTAAREGELQRARQEIARLTAEAERLRADLENLKKIDIDLERRRK